ncbi:MAG: hypothetical protein M3335_02290 [Actinomycetota bacterium]|jgi:hypothetical protein|nr:hypothetical protein [Actinomycetota bacterium]
MNRKQALIAFTIVVLTVEIVGISALRLLGASSEAIAFAYALLLSGAGLGVGGIFTRYRW